VVTGTAIEQGHCHAAPPNGQIEQGQKSGLNSLFFHAFSVYRLSYRDPDDTLRGDFRLTFTAALGNWVSSGPRAPAA
jgi:hypothetical protein